MKTITEKFLSGIKWNTIEACLYQGILWGYHVTLFSSLDRAFYGTIGTLFSLLYIGVTLCTLGLDSALSPFIRYYTHNKTSFRILLGFQCIPNIITYGSLLLFASCYDLNNMFSFFKMPPIDQSFILLLVLLLIIESIKKTVKTFLGLLFYNQRIATLEITYIILYVSTVAGLHYAHVPMSLAIIFVPMLIYSTIITGVLIGLLYTHYRQLPDSEYENEPALIGRITQSRIFGYINQLGHLIFSGNMFVTVFAAQLGVSYAAVAKIMSTSMQTISSITHRIIGQASEAALAHAHAYADNEKQSLFALSNTYAQSVILYLFALLFALNYKAVAVHVMNSSLHANVLLVVFSILLLIEPFFMTYEKKYLIEEKGRYLSYYHLTMIALFGLWIYSNCAYPLLCLVGLTSVRIAWYAALGMHHRTPQRVSRQTSLNILICLIVMSVIIIFS
jgi:hypothetical protein